MENYNAIPHLLHFRENAIYNSAVARDNGEAEVYNYIQYQEYHILEA